MRNRTRYTSKASTFRFYKVSLRERFREDIETILEGVPEERQTVLFSATMPKEIINISKSIQKEKKTLAKWKNLWYNIN